MTLRLWQLDAWARCPGSESNHILQGAAPHDVSIAVPKIHAVMTAKHMETHVRRHQYEEHTLSHCQSIYTPGHGTYIIVPVKRSIVETRTKFTGNTANIDSILIPRMHTHANAKLACFALNWWHRNVCRFRRMLATCSQT